MTGHGQGAAQGQGGAPKKSCPTCSHLQGFVNCGPNCSGTGPDRLKKRSKWRNDSTKYEGSGEAPVPCWTVQHPRLGSPATQGRLLELLEDWEGTMEEAPATALSLRTA